MIETHAHIYDEVFTQDLEKVIERAQAIGVKEIWMPNCDLGTISPMLDLAQRYSMCKPMMGLHPCYVTKEYKRTLKSIHQKLNEASYFMIGEIGLDFYWDLSLVNEQEKAFVKQLEWAKEQQIPICIHSRNSKDNKLNAIQRCCELIEDFNWKNLRGIFHCFSGNLEDAKRVIDLGFKIGIGGVATFKNGGLEKVLPYVPLESIILETDAPYLAPKPHRGKRNEPAYLSLIAERVSLLTGVSVSELEKQTTQNAKTLSS